MQIQQIQTKLQKSQLYSFLCRYTSEQTINFLFSIPLATLACISSYAFKATQTKYMRQQFGSRDDQKVDPLARQISRNYRSFFRYFQIFLPIKDYIRIKLSNIFINDTNYNKFPSNLYKFIGSTFIATFIPSFLLGVLYFMSGIPQVKMVSHYMQQQKLRKYYRERNKSMYQFWKQAMNRRYSGKLAHSIGFSLSNALNFCVFDTIQLYQSRVVKLLMLPNIFLGIIMSHLCNYLFNPFRILAMEKYRSKIQIDPKYQFLYSKKSYRQIFGEFWKKENKMKLFISAPHYVFIKNGIMLAVYQALKEIFNPIPIMH